LSTVFTLSFIGSSPVAITGPKTPKVSKFFARVHCANVGSVEDVGSRLVDAGVAENVAGRIGCGHRLAALADDDAQLALEDLAPESLPGVRWVPAEWNELFA
jgi:hypothetical protein